VAPQESVSVEVRYRRPRGLERWRLRLAVTVESMTGVSLGDADDAELVVRRPDGTVLRQETGSHVVLMSRAAEMRKDAEHLDESAFVGKWLVD
jgi:hypothetical protein